MSFQVSGRGRGAESRRRGCRPFAPRGERTPGVGSEERLLLGAPLDEVVSALRGVAWRGRPSFDEGVVGGSSGGDGMLKESGKSELVLREVEGVLLGPGGGVWKGQRVDGAGGGERGVEGRDEPKGGLNPVYE
jgi:hypothetical protein